MIPSYESFTWRTVQHDSLGMITGETDIIFKGISDEETVYDQTGGTLNVVGKGTVYSSDTTILPNEGDEVIVNSVTFVIHKVFRSKVYGVFHHWELVYG